MRARAPRAPRPIHVAMVSQWAPWGRVGGTERHTHEVASRLARMEGVRLTVVTIGTPDPGQERPYGVVVTDSRFMAWLRRIESGMPVGRANIRQVHDFLFNRKASREVRRLGADLVHRQGGFCLGLKVKVPLVVTLHNGTIPADEPVPSGWIHKVVYPLGELDRRRRMADLRRAIGRADAVICVSEHVRLKVLGRLGVRRPAHEVHDIPNGCSYPLAKVSKAGARKRLGLRPRERVVLFVGRLAPEKRISRLLPLLDEPDVVLAVLGVGEQEAQLRELAAGQPRLRVLGFQDEEAKRLWLRAADVLALPTGLFEGQPLVLMEALRSGTPVYGTHAEWLPPRLRRFGRFGDDVRLALDAMEVDASRAPPEVPGWDEVAAETLAAYFGALDGAEKR